MNPVTMVIIVLAVIVLYFVIVYNSLVRKKMLVENSWAQIDTQLQRRYDLIPNLVNTVKGYASHEKELFEKVSQARSNMVGNLSVKEKSEANASVTQSLRDIFAVAEAYPELKANENFRELQLELSNTENKISFSRQYYNDCVTRYNTDLYTFPVNIVAGIFKFSPKELFEPDSDKARKSVEVSF